MITESFLRIQSEVFSRIYCVSAAVFRIKKADSLSGGFSQFFEGSKTNSPETLRLTKICTGRTRSTKYEVINRDQLNRTNAGRGTGADSERK
jgi:hypothetical protein